MLPAQDALEAWLMQFMNGQDPQSAALLNLLRSQPKDERRASPMKPGVAPRVHVRVK